VVPLPSQGKPGEFDFSAALSWEAFQMEAFQAVLDAFQVA